MKPDLSIWGSDEKQRRETIFGVSLRLQQRQIQGRNASYLMYDFSLAALAGSMAWILLTMSWALNLSFKLR